MPEPVCVNDFEKLAENKLRKSDPAWGFISGGSMEEQTMKDNTKAFTRYRLRPRVLVDVSNVDVTTSVLGSKVNFPVCVAPFSVFSAFHEEILDRTCAVAKGAQAAGVGYTMNMWNNADIEDVARATPNAAKWLQVYFYKNRDMIERRVKRAERHGFKAIFVTVDCQVLPRRYTGASIDISNLAQATGLAAETYRSHRSTSNGSEKVDMASVIDPSANWSDVDWLKSITKLPIVVKGIVTAEMAVEAVRRGAAGVVVSNHGGRTLDCTPTSIDALQEVVRAVNGRCEVYLDGGVRTGTDVLKAVALGAKAVFVGRPIFWGLAHQGQKGVERVLQILKDEFKTSMQLMGCTSIDDLQLGKNLVVHESYYRSAL